MNTKYWRIADESGIPDGYVVICGSTSRREIVETFRTMDPRYGGFISLQKVDYFDENQNYLSSGEIYILFAKK